MEYYLRNWDHTLLMDMEAGVEHLGRGTAKDVDLLLIVVEPNMRAVETAERIRDLAKDLGSCRIYGVLNNVRNDKEQRWFVCCYTRRRRRVYRKPSRENGSMNSIT